jgi:hypothetical protein
MTSRSATGTGQKRAPVIVRIVGVGRLHAFKGDRELDADDARVGCDLVSG